jgi:hypothetical protein
MFLFASAISSGNDEALKCQIPKSFKKERREDILLKKGRREDTLLSFVKKTKIPIKS